MAVKKILKEVKERKSLKNIKIKYLTPDQIRQQLWDHGWINNTLSPISTEPFWEITANIIPVNAECISGIFAQSYAGAMVHKMFTFICTTKYVYSIMEVAGYVTYKILKYEDFAEVNLYQDEYLPSQIYIDIYLSKFRFFRLETGDPTSTLDFKKTIIKQQIALGSHRTLADIRNRTFAQRAGMTAWRFFWRKFRFILNIRTDAKVKRAIKKQRRLEAKAAKDAKKSADANNKVQTQKTHVESL